MKKKLEQQLVKLSHKLTKRECVYIFGVFLLMLLWAILQPYDYGPDEYMRYAIPRFIYQHGSLPLPWDPEVVNRIFNASYAYYPQFLPPIVSAILMKVMSVFTMNETFLVVAARLTSVISGAVFVYYSIKISKRIFPEGAKRWFFIILSSMIPQFIFISSYVNNDAMALCSSGMIIYAWICGMQDGWNYKNTILLTSGIAICALSYYNAYGWILMSIIFFIGSFITRKKDDANDKIKWHFEYKPMLKYGSIIAAIVLCCISFFFIRNAMLNQGDILGIKSFLQACEGSPREDIRPSLRTTAQNRGLTYMEMLNEPTETTGPSFANATFRTFIGEFGYLQFKIHPYVVSFYKILFWTAAVGCLIMLIQTVVKRFTKKEKMNSLLFYICLGIGILIPIALSIQYSYATDYQPQGRYIYSILAGVAIFSTLGIGKIVALLTVWISNPKIAKVISMLLYSSLIAIMVFAMLFSANKTFLASLGY